MTEKTFKYSNCTVTVQIPSDNAERVKKATVDFLKKVIADQEHNKKGGNK